MSEKQELKIPEDLRSLCPNCYGVGSVILTGFTGGDVTGGCPVCHARGWLWKLDQQEMAERIAAKDAELATLRTELEAARKRIERLSAPVQDEEICAAVTALMNKWEDANDGYRHRSMRISVAKVYEELMAIALPAVLAARGKESDEEPNAESTL